MPRITPDGYSKVWFTTTIVSIAAPTLVEIELGEELTPFLTRTGIDTPEEGTDADSSSLASPRDFSVPATIGGDIVGELYRDDTADDAWDALARLTEGYLVIARFGGGGTDNAIAVADVVEVYPVRVSQRSPARLTGGETQRFVTRFALSTDPNLAATVA